MRVSVFLFLLGIISISISNAQPNPYPKLLTGITVLPGFTQTDLSGTRRKISLGGEVVARLRLAEFFSIESGVGVINRGWKDKYSWTDSLTGESFTEWFPYQFNYLYVPLRIQFRASGVYVNGGPAINRFINSNPSLYKPYGKEVMTCWQLGAGYEFELPDGTEISAGFMWSNQPVSAILKDQKIQNFAVTIRALFQLQGPGGFRD